MQLTRYSDYALRALMFLAIREGELVTISEISDRYNISRNHVVKVVQQLSKIGYIDATRGRGGGLKLAKKPEDIGVGDIIRRTEKQLEMIDCWNPRCVLASSCLLDEALCEARDAFLKKLDEYTIADLTKNKARLLALVG
jgi:Rrf2 family nitric oxide-sensitive transcriptional repressor